MNTNQSASVSLRNPDTTADLAAVELARTARLAKAEARLRALKSRLASVRYIVHPGISNLRGELYFYSYRELLNLRGISPSEALSSGDTHRTRFVRTKVTHIYPPQ